MLQAIPLRRSDLNDPDGRVPCSLVGAMFGRAMQKRPLKNLGTRIAAETPIGAFPLIDYLVLTSESVGQGLKKLSQYFRLVDFPVLLNIREEESRVQILYEGPPGGFGFEFGMSGAMLQRIMFPLFPIVLGIHSLPEFWEYFVTSNWLSTAIVLGTAEWWIRSGSHHIPNRHVANLTAR